MGVATTPAVFVAGLEARQGFGGRAGTAEDLRVRCNRHDPPRRARAAPTRKDTGAGGNSDRGSEFTHAYKYVWFLCDRLTCRKPHPSQWLIGSGRGRQQIVAAGRIQELAEMQTKAVSLCVVFIRSPIMSQAARVSMANCPGTRSTADRRGAA